MRYSAAQLLIAWHGNYSEFNGVAASSGYNLTGLRSVARIQGVHGNHHCIIKVGVVFINYLPFSEQCPGNGYGFSWHSLWVCNTNLGETVFTVNITIIGTMHKGADFSGVSHIGISGWVPHQFS
jgi:hypothetical protein